MKRKVYVEGADFSIVSMFLDHGFNMVTSFEEADLICFSGGTDVNAGLYGEYPSPMNDRPDVERDNRCVFLYNYAVANGLPVVGICRGAQFITVMQGGKLKQHLGDTHTEFLHKVTLVEPTHKTMEVTSSHHQEMIPAHGVQTIGKSEDGVVEVTIKERGGHGGPVELCVQSHPEWQDEGAEFRQWFISAVEHMLED